MTSWHHVPENDNTPVVVRLSPLRLTGCLVTIEAGHRFSTGDLITKFVSNVQRIMRPRASFFENDEWHPLQTHGGAGVVTLQCIPLRQWDYSDFIKAVKTSALYLAISNQGQFDESSMANLQRMR